MTSTDLSTIHDGAVVPDTSDKALSRLLAQAKSMQAANQLGQALARTSMVPEIYQQFPPNKPENEAAGDNATAAILFGAELGLSAVQSLQNVFIVRGKPAIYARTMVAQVVAAGHMVWEVETGAESVTWKGRRADNGTEFTSTWTMDRAKLAGYTSNTLYQKSPVEMLRAKSQAEVCRTLFADVLLGIAYSKEDLDLTDEPRHVESTVRTNSVDALRAQLGGSQNTPESKPAAGVAAKAAPKAKLITEAQMKKLHALMNEKGLGDRETGLAWIGACIEREITTTKDLTTADASKVIDTLTNDGEIPADTTQEN